MFQSHLLTLLLLAICANCEKDGISYGKVAKVGQFPYHVEFTAVPPRKGEGHHCGGALISNQWILSAYHCFYLFFLGMEEGHPEAFNSIAYLGSVNVTSKQSGIPIKKSNVYKHPNSSYLGPFDPAPIVADIVLIKLPSPVKFTDRIQPMQLPDKNLPMNYFDGRLATVSGFGLMESGQSDVLRYTNLTVISNEECAQRHTGDPTIDECICTMPGKNGENPCVGDSGGPVVGIEGTKPVLIGVVSRPEKKENTCGGVKPTTTAHTRVTLFMDWIEATIAQN